MTIPFNLGKMHEEIGRYMKSPIELLGKALAVHKNEMLLR